MHEGLRNVVRDAGRAIALAAALILVQGCRAPIGARQTNSTAVYRQVHENPLSANRPGGRTRFLLRQLGQESVFASDPDAALRRLHEAAVDSGDRELLFALSELSYIMGNQLSRNVKPWEPRDPRHYFLSSAVYAWFFLFAEPRASLFDTYNPEFRVACDLYNHGLAWALMERSGTNAQVRFTSGPRRLAIGDLNVSFDQDKFNWPVSEFSRFVAADRFVVRGLSMRNRQPGIGAPLIAVGSPIGSIAYSRCVSATAVLRLHGALRDLKPGGCAATLELYSSYDHDTTAVNGAAVPLEIDTTASVAYSLNQSSVWTLGSAQFMSGIELIPTGVYQSRPYEPGKIPVVFVHGTFSSPVWWAEMFNSLAADPVLRSRYQLWWFVYNSGNPTIYSADRLRRALTDKIKELDPDGKDPALQQMVVIGHSQGGLLTKLTATDTGDAIWKAYSTNRIERLMLSREQERLVRECVFLKPLPFVKRVVFIATPHRGSYRVRYLVQRLGRRFVRLPATLIRQERALWDVATRAEVKGLGRSLRTSLDSMSPRNRGFLALADIPVAQGITAHSIIAVRGDGDYTKGKDGLVAYSSAHVDYAESEYIVRGSHTCLSNPATIEEVRRILRLHVNSLGTRDAPSP